MFRRRHPNVALVATTLVWALASPVLGQTPSTASRPDNYYAAGERVDVARPMDGDVVVAGRTVTIGEAVGGDILAAGWQVSLTAPARDDVRIAASSVSIDAPVTGDLTVAGGDVTTGPRTQVSGRAWLTGDVVRVQGVFDRDLQIAGRSVVVGGEIRQPLRVVAEQLEVLPGARLLAPVSYRGVAPAVVAAGAEVSTPIAFERIERRDAENARAWPAVSTLLFVVHLLLVGMLVVFLAPTFEPSVVGALRARPWQSLLAGFALLVSVPVAAVLLVLSVFGLPLGLALGMVFTMALFAAVLATAFVIGDLEARLVKAAPRTTRGQHAAWLLAGVVTLAVLRLLLGGVVLFASTLLGLGALTLWMYDRRTSRPAASPA